MIMMAVESVQHGLRLRPEVLLIDEPT